MQTLTVSDGTLLDSIAEFCRRKAMAESTFGRHAVNDGKFVARLRDGARITPETLERVSTFMGRHGMAAPASPSELRQLIRVFPGGPRRPPTRRRAKMRRRAISASSTIARSTCSSSTPAARRK